MRYITDSTWNATGVNRYGDFMNITNLNYPTSVEPNTPFDITYEASNNSVNALNAYGYIFDLTAQQQVPGSYWEATVPAQGSLPVTVHFNGITTPFSGEVRVGHIEGEGCTGPAASEGDYVCGDASYANAPAVGHRYQCTGGTWNDLGVDTTNCPSIPPPPGINPMMLMGIVAAVVVVGVVFMVAKK